MSTVASETVDGRSDEVSHTPLSSNPVVVAAVVGLSATLSAAVFQYCGKQRELDVERERARHQLQLEIKRHEHKVAIDFFPHATTPKAALPVLTYIEATATSTALREWARQRTIATNRTRQELIDEASRATTRAEEWRVRADQLRLRIAELQLQLRRGGEQSQQQRSEISKLRRRLRSASRTAGFEDQRAEAAWREVDRPSLELTHWGETLVDSRGERYDFWWDLTSYGIAGVFVIYGGTKRSPGQKRVRAFIGEEMCFSEDLSVQYKSYPRAIRAIRWNAQRLGAHLPADELDALPGAARGGRVFVGRYWCRDSEQRFSLTEEILQPK